MDRKTSEITVIASRKATSILAILALAVTVLMPFVATPQTTLNAGDPVTNSVREGDVQAVRDLVVRNAALNVADLDGRTPLILATIASRLDIVEVLLEARARSEFKDGLGNTALHWAAINGDLEIAELLIEAGVQVDERNKQGLTPLMLAAKGGNVGVVELLLEHGGDIGLTDYTGRDATGWARQSRQPALIRLLEQASGD